VSVYLPPVDAPPVVPRWTPGVLRDVSSTGDVLLSDVTVFWGAALDFLFVVVVVTVVVVVGQTVLVVVVVVVDVVVEVEVVVVDKSVEIMTSCQHHDDDDNI